MVHTMTASCAVHSSNDVLLTYILECAFIVVQALAARDQARTLALNGRLAVCVIQSTHVKLLVLVRLCALQRHEQHAHALSPVLRC
jgi:hypothetical protein